MTVYQAEQEVKNERIIERLAIIDELLADHKAQLNRILDLYLEGNFPKELLVEKKARLEHRLFGHWKAKNLIYMIFLKRKRLP
jgi:hypothetical protein